MAVERIVVPDMGDKDSHRYECECDDGCIRPLDERAFEALVKYAEDIGMENYSIIATGCTNPRKGDIKAYADHKGTILCALYREEIIGTFSSEELAHQAYLERIKEYESHVSYP